MSNYGIYDGILYFYVCILIKGEIIMNVKDLIASYLKGNKQSFDKLYKKTASIARASILIYITDQALVDEFVLKSYTVFKENIDSYDISSPFEKYIYCKMNIYFY